MTGGPIKIPKWERPCGWCPYLCPGLVQADAGSTINVSTTNASPINKNFFILTHLLKNYSLFLKLSDPTIFFSPNLIFKSSSNS